MASSADAGATSSNEAIRSITPARGLWFQASATHALSPGLLWREGLGHSFGMPFELSLRYSTPLTPITDLDEVLREFLRLVGYLPEGEEGRGAEGPIGQSLAYRLVRECFVRDPARPWYIEELTAVLKTSKPTIYRHINKLKALDLLEEVGGVADGKGRKGYRLRYGSLAKAWDFTEANAQNALRRYRETVNHLQGLVETQGPEAPTPKVAPSRGRGAAR
jgi:DNA-binding transcriptional ArsR family regulator